MRWITRQLFEFAYCVIAFGLLFFFLPFMMFDWMVNKIDRLQRWAYRMDGE